MYFWLFEDRRVDVTLWTYGTRIVRTLDWLDMAHVFSMGLSTGDSAAEFQGRYEFRQIVDDKLE